MSLIPIYFLTKDNKIDWEYISHVELYKLYHWKESNDEEFINDFKKRNQIEFTSHISYNLDKVKKKYQEKNGREYTGLIQKMDYKHIDTIKPDNYDDLISDTSNVLTYCIDIYGNIVEVFVPKYKMYDTNYWIKQAQQYKLICDSDYLPFRYPSKGEGLKKVKEKIVQTICRKTTATYCFYDTEMEDGYYKCYGIKFPVEEKMLSTIKSQSSESFIDDFSKIKIYYKDEIKQQLEIGNFFHKTIFKIDDTEINLTPSKEEIKKLESLPKYKTALAYMPKRENPKKEIITLIDSNEAKKHSPTTNKNFVARITINKDSKDYGKVIRVDFGMNKDTNKKYTPEEARKLLLVNCARKYKHLAKSTEENFLDLVLSNPEYYTSKDCPVRLPNCYEIRTRDDSTTKLEQELKLCTDNLSNGSNMIIPIANTFHMFVIVANKKDDKISFKIFDPSKALQLENKEKLEQRFGKYIYEHLDEKYILSPEERIQNALLKHNLLFSPTCTGISTEYINYIIDNGQDKNPQQLTEEEGKKIQERYAKHVVENGLHHIISGEQQTEQQAVKQETKSQDKPSVKKKKTTLENKPLQETTISTSTTIKKKDPNSKPIKIETKPQDKPSVKEKTTTVENKPQDKPSVKENKTVVEEKTQAQPVVKNEIVDKKEVKPAVSVAVNDTDKKPIQEEITVRNAPVETPKQYLIKTEFVDGKLKMTLIEYKEEEHKKDFVKFCNDNHILFTKKVTKEGDKYGCLFTEERAQDIINNKDGILNKPDYIYIYTNNKYINKNDYIEEQKKKEEEQKRQKEEEQKKKEEEQKNKEEEQKKNGLSGISSLKDINKNNQVEKTSKGGFNFIGKLSNLFGKKSTNSEKQTLLNTSEEKKPSKGRWWNKKRER